jgi:GST-like protein
MYVVHTAETPNGIKVPIALEELCLPYRIAHVDLRAGAQRGAEFLALNPNGRIPVLAGTDAGGTPLRIAESGAILLHLAESAGALLPRQGTARALALEWLFLQVSSIGPVFGTLRALAQEPGAGAVVARFHEEALRLLALADRRLAEDPWLGGAEYSIADIACYGWLRAGAYVGLGMESCPKVAQWLERIDARPAVQRALHAIRQAQRARAA